MKFFYVNCSEQLIIPLGRVGLNLVNLGTGQTPAFHSLGIHYNQGGETWVAAFQNQDLNQKQVVFMIDDSTNPQKINECPYTVP